MALKDTTDTCRHHRRRHHHHHRIGAKSAKSTCFASGIGIASGLVSAAPSSKFPVPSSQLDVCHRLALTLLIEFPAACALFRLQIGQPRGPGSKCNSDCNQRAAINQQVSNTGHWRTASTQINPSNVSIMMTSSTPVAQHSQCTETKCYELF